MQRFQQLNFEVATPAGFEPATFSLEDISNLWARLDRAERQA